MRSPGDIAVTRTASMVKPINACDGISWPAVKVR